MGLAAPASAASVLDAHATTIAVGDPTLGASWKNLAQTFKAQNSGLLDQVDLHYGNNWWASQVKASVFDVSQGNLVAPAASTVPAAQIYPFSADWHTFLLTTKVSVQAGQTYAIVLSSGAIGSDRWSYNTGARYTDGQMYTVSSTGTSLSAPFSLGTGAAFLFRTFVETSAGLSITSSAASTSAPEGTAPTMKGTYSGGVGTAHFTADHGSVAADAAAGTWTWTGDKYDEDSYPSSVTVTVTDDSGASQSTTFALTINGVRPAAGISTGGTRLAAASTTSLSTPEGSSLTLTGTASSPSATDQAAGFKYEWSVVKNGSALAPVTGATYTVTTTDEDTFVVTMTARDDGGLVSDPVTVTVVGAEIKPTATILSISAADPALTIIAPEETLNFAGTYNDPAPEPHTFRWDFGDGATASSLTAAHAYATAGTYTVTLTVWDDEKVSGSATATVTVLSAQAAIASMTKYVEGIKTLNAGQQNSLVAKLNAASDAISRGNDTAAHNQLNAFVNELDADLQAGKISKADYNALRADAHAVEGAVGTFNRFLEWWPLAA